MKGNISSTNCNPRSKTYAPPANETNSSALLYISDKGCPEVPPSVLNDFAIMFDGEAVFSAKCESATRLIGILPYIKAVGYRGSHYDITIRLENDFGFYRTITFTAFKKLLKAYAGSYTNKLIHEANMDALAKFESGAFVDGGL